MLNKGDLVYIPLLGTKIYTIEDIIGDRIVVDGNFIEIAINTHEKIISNKDTSQNKGHFNYRTGYISGEGRVLINEEMPTISGKPLDKDDEFSFLDIDDTQYTKDVKFVNITSKLVYPATLKNHAILEYLTEDTYEKVFSPNETTRLLLENGAVLTKATDKLLYKDLVDSDVHFTLITSYDENTSTFYDSYDNPYTLAIPIDNRGKEIIIINKGQLDDNASI